MRLNDTFTRTHHIFSWTKGERVSLYPKGREKGGGGNGRRGKWCRFHFFAVFFSVPTKSADLNEIYYYYEMKSQTFQT